MAFKVQAIPNTKVLFGESPIWDGRRKGLIFMDCFAKSICIFDPATSSLSKKVVTPPGQAIDYTLVAMPCARDKDKLVVSTSLNELLEFDWSSGQVSGSLLDLKLASPSSEALTFNYAKCDGKGRYWTGGGVITDMDNLGIEEGKGEVYVISKDDEISGNLNCSKKDSNFNLPNGLGFSPDFSKLFYADINRKDVSVYDFELETGKIGNRKTLLKFKDEPSLQSSSPDGLCVDANGHPWIACWKGGCVIEVDGNTGKLLERLPIPVTNTASVAFGGDSFQTLYVTTTSVEISQASVEGEPDAGKLFEIRNERDNSFRGFQEHFFNH